jgi:hypothetical protein
MPTRNKDSWNRDDELKPGAPPGGVSSGPGSNTDKTMTDPASGAARSKAPAPNQARTDQTDGAG